MKEEKSWYNRKRGRKSMGSLSADRKCILNRSYSISHLVYNVSGERWYLSPQVLIAIEGYFQRNVFKPVVSKPFWIAEDLRLCFSAPHDRSYQTIVHMSLISIVSSFPQWLYIFVKHLQIGAKITAPPLENESKRTYNFPPRTTHRLQIHREQYNDAYNSSTYKTYLGS